MEPSEQWNQQIFSCTSHNPARTHLPTGLNYASSRSFPLINYIRASCPFPTPISGGFPNTFRTVAFPLVATYKFNSLGDDLVNGPSLPSIKLQVEHISNLVTRPEQLINIILGMCRTEAEPDS